jgi:gliding motility-associated-like protein
MPGRPLQIFSDRLLVFFFFILLGMTPLVSFSQKHNLLPDTIFICGRDSGTIEVKHHFESTAMVRWKTPHGHSASSKKLTVTVPGCYRITIQSNQLNYPLQDSTWVKFVQRPRPVLRDTFICRNGSALLDAGNPGMKYTWSSKETSRRIKVSAPGIYWVRMSNGSCALQDTCRVRLYPGPEIIQGKDVVFCYNDENKILSAHAEPGEKITWSTGATTSVIAISREGVYKVTAEGGVCKGQSDSTRVKMKACDCEMIIPNSFTPNEDNKNDYFFPVLQCEYVYYNISITDRWGNTVYASASLTGKWDGRYKGVPCPEDVYVYRIESLEKGLEKKMVRTGHVSLFR